jgi:methylated-DNA-protein-cysteine methyltransferase related protein
MSKFCSSPFTHYSLLITHWIQMSFYDQVYAVVRCVPVGQVTTYGRVAQMLGRPQAARAVGYALNALQDKPNHTVPWQRVVNAQGRISLVNREYSGQMQAELLRQEGVAVDEQLCLDLSRYLWAGLSLFELDEIVNDSGQ